jgi:hypothetical protein
MLKIRNDEPLINGTTTYFASQIEGDPSLAYNIRYVSDLSLFARRANFITVNFLMNRSRDGIFKLKRVEIGGTPWRGA